VSRCQGAGATLTLKEARASSSCCDCFFRPLQKPERFCNPIFSSDERTAIAKVLHSALSLYFCGHVSSCPICGKSMKADFNAALDDPANFVAFGHFCGSSISSTEFASGPGFGLLDHAPELKSLGIDCFPRSPRGKKLWGGALSGPIAPVAVQGP